MADRHLNLRNSGIPASLLKDGRKASSQKRKPARCMQTGTHNPSILSVTTNASDARALDRTFRESRWTEQINAECSVIACASLARASSLLRKGQFAIVVCNDGLVDGTWRDMLAFISLLPDPPLLIVTSRLADERLWAEALNVGAHDILVQPFDVTEVVRILTVAWQHWQDRHGVHRARTLQRMASSGD